MCVYVCVCVSICREREINCKERDLSVFSTAHTYDSHAPVCFSGLSLTTRSQLTLPGHASFQTSDLCVSAIHAGVLPVHAGGGLLHGRQGQDADLHQRHQREVSPSSGPVTPVPVSCRQVCTSWSILLSLSVSVPVKLSL